MTLGRLVMATLVVVGLVGCGDPKPSSTVTVFAASSLARPLASLVERYEDEHPDRDVVVSVAGSQSLVAQIRQGAPADVVATADEETMRVVADQLLSPSVVFARNRLAVIATPGSGVLSLEDLGRPGLRVVLGGPTVPVGKAARRALATAGVTVQPVSLEPDVASVVAKVTSGEADAALVYATDLASAGAAVVGTVLPPVVTSLLVGALTERGREFAAFLSSAPARAVLTAAGFLPP